MDDKISLEEALTYVSTDFIIAAAQGFKAGMKGKGYKKNNWLDVGLRPEEVLPSFLGHIAQVMKNKPDPETGDDPIIFEAARAVMHVTLYLKNKERV